MRRWTTGRSCARSWSGARPTSTRTLHICWGAQAGLYYHYGIPKQPLPEKLFGVFRHTGGVSKRSILFRGFDDEFCGPPLPAHRRCGGRISRRCRTCKILASSRRRQASTPSLPSTGRQIFITGHSEYDARHAEKRIPAGRGRRDAHSASQTLLSRMTTPTQQPLVRWRSSANLLCSATGSTTSSIRQHRTTCGR